MPEPSESSTDVLRGSGLRATPARKAVIDVLRETHNHMTVSEVISALAGGDSKFDQSTVYRVLSDLGGVGLVAESRLSPGDTVFEWISQSNHHHIQCTECGRTLPLDDELVQEFISKVHERHGFHVNATHLVLSGIEHDCPGA
ncbi:MAG TPA: transcriptional repressor [Dehalococcoidia bacterium]|jgi:Fe2+ or Zn2+ uptake regulation protein|nr:transcriptional repressor [Dehalococcoidia bacterium]HIK88751.1 transcriptional repressor [Dehalococcoidia bacterium]